MPQNDDLEVSLPIRAPSSKSTRAVFRARWIGRAAGLAGTGASLTVLAGWWFDVPALRRILPGQPPMVVLTAIGVLLLGLSLLVATLTALSRSWRSFGQCLAGLAAAVGIGGLFQHLLPGTYRLDDQAQRLLFGPLKPSSGMALASAAGILGSAMGLLLQDLENRWLRRLGGLAAVFGFVVAAVGLLGYGYGLGVLHQSGPFSRMALVTAITLGILSAGIILSRPSRPWVAAVLGGGDAATLTRHLLPSVVLAPLILGWLVLQGFRAGYIEAETGMAVLVILLVLWLAGLTIRLAHSIDRRAATERKLRDTLQDMNEALERRVAERTRELTAAQDALVQSQKMEAIGQLTGGGAHDFNNLLTIIRSSVEFLRRPDLPEERRRRYMDAVSDTVTRAAKLTGQLLAFARRQALRPEVFDAGARIRAIAEMLDSLTGARVRIVTHLPSDPCYVRADASQFETALVNLAVNARDAMEGEGALTIRLACGRAMPAIRGHAGSATPFVSVEVTDTGSGIAREHLTQVFEPFFTTKEVGKGTGIGLSQVIGFTKQSGGDVDVTSVVGRGTTFTLYLPQADAEGNGTMGDPEPEGPAIEMADKCVLVVEDNVEVGRFCAQILHDLGYGTVLAQSGEAALAEIEAVPFRFDAVFSDVVMPGMGGIELAKRLRELHPELPVILTTGYSHVLAQDDGHGFELVRKPYSAEEISKALSWATRRKLKVPPATLVSGA
ncbi:UNVERIFIED_ORG: signal transduction histidine kinase/ActR/RegA family two-component response regulator [Methylobacterium sp. SuP10 SLI 274]|nr:signal transduction histidine kinase/ActR/RegA family two-component response regulator [Methylorubrum extorquens]MDF9861351.1 signal transduction histidine kinase/ActR/RegA family two-component response regulator [Methylorubrum pseudosasae]MDH6634978.1 signal transduction histidine kinase/ActR/RegA family two-component response regulator [Methylobacterium sp. SuP10 SLI 274]MDH6664149.1 signal transduction histidine kinase/ActR/RegA family two-component response regulator [Methylorubrum zatman